MIAHLDLDPCMQEHITVKKRQTNTCKPSLLNNWRDFQKSIEHDFKAYLMKQMSSKWAVIYIWPLCPSHSISVHENDVLGFYFCSHFLSSGRNILKFDMKIIQHFKRIWFKTGEIWNTKVICYFSPQICSNWTF